jgi:hypothetical protein
MKIQINKEDERDEKEELVDDELLDPTVLTVLRVILLAEIEEVEEVEVVIGC